MANGDIPDSDTHHKEHEESDKDTYATPKGACRHESNGCSHCRHEQDVDAHVVNSAKVFTDR